jgi:hypothetical protein
MRFSPERTRTASKVPFFFDVLVVKISAPVKSYTLFISIPLKLEEVLEKTKGIREKGGIFWFSA